MSSNAWSARGTEICSGITSAPQPSSRICRSAISERMPPPEPPDAAPMANTRPLKAV